MYPIPIESAQFETLRQWLSKQHYSSIWILTDSNTEKHCLPILQAAISEFGPAKLICIPAGENHKNIDTCQYIWQCLLEGGADRKALLLNLGGGVIGDMGGFCAATYKRGMDFVQIPTTLLAQVDASVGGKLGIDFSMVKNAIGVFQYPRMVAIYPGFLKTLPERELRSGFAEIIKHALIADASHWDYLQTLPDLNSLEIDWAPIIRHSVAIKDRVVTEDPTEKGLRKILNFGHTIGHAIESLSWETENALLHGEAVALGMMAEAYLSHHLLGLSANSLQEICDFIRKNYPPYDISVLDKKALLALMHQDKKNEGKGIAFSLLNSIGSCAYNVQAEESLILESLEYITQH